MLTTTRLQRNGLSLPSTSNDACMPSTVTGATGHRPTRNGRYECWLRGRERTAGVSRAVLRVLAPARRRPLRTNRFAAHRRDGLLAGAPEFGAGPPQGLEASTRPWIVDASM